MKRDAAQIQAFIHDLAKRPWLAVSNRAHWPKYVFRVDDVRAAAAILESGWIFSRNHAAAQGVIHHDSADAGVIGNSPDWIKDYVRLYFRPKTPTEYKSEGFRPVDDQQGAHRPMPVVLVFDSVATLTQTGTLFTSGNAATHGTPSGDDIAFLRTIPFEKVYHVGAMTESEKREVVFRRCAEVLVPKQMDLKNLRHILCRTQAEYETLLSLLSPQTRATFSKLIGVSDKVHHKNWTFVESVDLSKERVTIKFNPTTWTPEPFKAVSIISDAHGKAVGQWQAKAFRADGTLTLNLRKLENPPAAYRVKLTLDGALAYQGAHKPTEELL